MNEKIVKVRTQLQGMVVALNGAIQIIQVVQDGLKSADEALLEVERAMR